MALITTGGMVAFLILVSGLLTVLRMVIGDPSPGREVASLEIVTGDADDATCILNREDTAAGAHEVSVFWGSPGAAVELRDETGSTVFRREDPGPDPAMEQMDADPLTLAEGRYTVVCLYPNGETGEVPLTVTADRGHKDRSKTTAANRNN